MISDNYAMVYGDSREIEEHFPHPLPITIFLPEITILFF